MQGARAHWGRWPGQHNWTCPRASAETPLKGHEDISGRHHLFHGTVEGPSDFSNKQTHPPSGQQGSAQRRAASWHSRQSSHLRPQHPVWARSRASCCTSDPAPCSCTLENSGRRQVPGLVTHTGNPDEAPGSWLQLGSAQP